MSETPNSYLIETTRIGNQVKVTACDPDSGIEATVILPANATKKEMTDLAIRKLHYVMEKKAKT
jgi:hypothetical protein